MKPLEIEKLLLADGWVEIKSNGPHRSFKHPTKPGKISLSRHKTQEIKGGTLRSIEIQSGLNLRSQNPKDKP